MSINFCRLFDIKIILVEEQSWHYLIHSLRDKEVHTFPKGIVTEDNVMARLEFELVYYDVLSGTLATTPRGLSLRGFVLVCQLIKSIGNFAVEYSADGR